MSEPSEDFYVGYRPRTSPAIRAWIRRVAAALLTIASLLPLPLVWAQRAFEEAVFEYGKETALTGTVRATPYPVLEVGDGRDERPYLLVGRGKKGAQHEVAGLDGRHVEVRGERIYRDDQRMLQLREARLLAAAAPAEPAAVGRTIGRFTLAGEIVDSKCYLGVMQPGRGKPHRDCAVRCISGGMPPIFLVTDRQGNRRHYLLVGSDGRPLNSEILDYVAEPIAIDGEVARSAGLWYLRAEPGTFRRLRRVESDFETGEHR